MDFLALAGNLKRRASVILDSTETKAKEDEEDGKQLKIDDLEREVRDEVLTNPAVEAMPQKGYQNPLERCLSARESRMRRRSISDAGGHS